MTDMIRRFPNVLLAEVPCPIADCDATIPIEGALVVGWETGAGGSPFIKVGSMVDSTSIEFHMIEHGLDPKRQEVPE